jgi:RNA polymerase sigma-32 factor
MLPIGFAPPFTILFCVLDKLQRRIFAGLQKAECAIAALEGRNLEEVAEQYGTSGESYQAIASSFLRRDFSIDSDHGDEGDVLELPAPGETPEQQLERKDWKAFAHNRLEQAMAALSDRDRYVIRQRRLMDPPATLKELSEELGVSIERVRQLEARAMKKMGEMCTDLSDVGLD